MALYERSQMPRAYRNPRAGKVCDSAGLFLHKRKDGGAQWIYHYWCIVAKDFFFCVFYILCFKYIFIKTVFVFL
ncbi:hypothetical protein CEV08_05540 [Bartonella tribocorum]|uniref:Integrase n=1 Tax=Bartonella tribocorum TaxID=85701 RepID=A0A2M6UU59_9HYPH|nr:hypothetical protein CEV08_05540 [Bartonella tribocorum]